MLHMMQRALLSCQDSQRSPPSKVENCETCCNRMGLVAFLQTEQCFTCTGTLLRSMAFPVALHSSVMDPVEHSLHVGSADGRIFQVSLVRSTFGPCASARKKSPLPDAHS